MRRTYRGAAIEVSFDLSLCVHIGECLRRSPEVFELRRRPWIVPDASDATGSLGSSSDAQAARFSTGASMAHQRSAGLSRRA